jgi:hypothetical protein
MGKHDQAGEVSMIPADQVQSIVAAAVRSALESIADRPAPRPNAEETMRMMTAEMRPKSAKVVREIPCHSPLTGADFDAESQDGIIVTLKNYREPEGAKVSAKDGGLIPEGVQHAKHWTYENFLQRDLRAYVGKPESALLGTGSAIVTPSAA